MTDRESDWLLQLQPYGTKEAMRAQRWMVLALALFGTSIDALQRQLLVPSPELPSGFALSDFQELRRHLQSALVSANNPRKAWVYPWPPPTLVVGSQRLTVLEACCEIVQRAIEYLEDR